MDDTGSRHVDQRRKRLTARNQRHRHAEYAGPLSSFQYSALIAREARNVRSVADSLCFAVRIIVLVLGVLLPPTAVANDTSARVHYDALVAAARRDPNSIDVRALEDAYMALPDMEARTVAAENTAVTFDVDNPNAEVAAADLAKLEAALDQSFASLTLHMIALAMAEAAGDKPRAEAHEVMLGRLSQRVAASGDGTTLRPWSVLTSSDAHIFALLAGFENYGARFVLSGASPLLGLQSRAADNPDGLMDEQLFSVRVVDATVLVRLRQAMPGISPALQFLAFASAIGRTGESVGLTTRALTLAQNGMADTEAEKGTASRLAALETLNEEPLARVALAHLQLEQDRPAKDEQHAHALDELLSLGETGTTAAILTLAGLMSRGSIDEFKASDAISLLRRHTDKGTASIHLALGVELLYDGKTDEAEQWLLRAADGGMMEALTILAWERLKSNKLDAALLDRLPAAVQRSDPLATLVTGLVRLKGAAGAIDIAAANADLLQATAIAHTPNTVNEAAYEMVVGSAYGLHPDIAAKMMQSLLQVFPVHAKEPAYVDTLAMALAASGDRARGTQMLQDLLRSAEPPLTGSTRHMVTRHLERLTANLPVSNETDAEDLAAFEARESK